jgi:hypothetical protein
MDKNLKIDLIKQAQNHLINNPQDYLHEITHHYRTVLLAKDITNNIEGSLDSDLLEVLCWWHDVKVPNLNYGDNRIAKVVSEYLGGLLPNEYKNNVLDSIENHEFGSKPTFMEGKVLQDADKLEILSPERIRIGIDAVEAGLLDKDSVLGKFNEVIQNWIPKMPERYNFTYSKEQHFILLEKVKPDFENLKKYLSS